MSWSELAPLRPEDFEVILLGPWGIDLIPCLLSPHGWLWITPRELQLHSLHWNRCLLRGALLYRRLKQRFGKLISKDLLLILIFLFPLSHRHKYFFSRHKCHNIWRSQLYAVMYYPLLNPLVLLKKSFAIQGFYQYFWYFVPFTELASVTVWHENCPEPSMHTCMPQVALMMFYYIVIV